MNSPVSPFTQTYKYFPDDMIFGSILRQGHKIVFVYPYALKGFGTLLLIFFYNAMFFQDVGEHGSSPIPLYICESL